MPGSPFASPDGNEWFIPCYGLIVAETAGKVLGFASYSHKPEHTEIDEIDVSRKIQGKGIGRVLVQYIETAAKRRNKMRPVTGTLVNAQGRSWKAHGFWLKLGFTGVEKMRTTRGTRFVRLEKSLAMKE